MIADIILAIWLFLPAGVANLVPVLAAHAPVLKRWEAPLDFGRTWRSVRVLGDHKTWRGLLAGVLCGGLIFLLQRELTGSLGALNGHSHEQAYNDLPVWFGCLLGFGALAGDAAESFFKRQIGIASGKSWFPFDQIDYIIGAGLLSLFFIVLPLYVYVLILVIWFGLHLLFGYIGYRLHLKKTAV